MWCIFTGLDIIVSLESYLHSRNVLGYMLNNTKSWLILKYPYCWNKSVCMCVCVVYKYFVIEKNNKEKLSDNMNFYIGGSLEFFYLRLLCLTCHFIWFFKIDNKIFFRNKKNKTIVKFVIFLKQVNKFYKRNLKKKIMTWCKLFLEI